MIKKKSKHYRSKAGKHAFDSGSDSDSDSD